MACQGATHVNCMAGDTLIFLDEIQEARNGITALKYFYENAPQLHVIVAGSLLGIEIHRRASFPVGKVQFLTLYPMNFREFLLAMGEMELARMQVENRWDEISMFAPKLKELLKYYYYVGGMPEVVQSFSQFRDWQEVRDIQIEILKSYERDFSKHAPGDIAPRIPLKSYEDRNAFKIYCMDIGLLGAMAELDSMTIVNGNTIFTEFKGALTEQYVHQQLSARHNLYYYSKPNSQQEIDFLIQEGKDIVPIEVKAEVNAKAKSLRQFVKENQSCRAYRISMNDYAIQDWLTNIPLYSL